MNSRLFLIILSISQIFKSRLEVFDHCSEPKIDGIMWSYKTIPNTTIYIFSNFHFFQFDYKKEKLNNEKRIKDVWPDVEVPIDGVSALKSILENLTYFEEEIIFQKGRRYWIYPSRLKYRNKETVKRFGNISLSLEETKSAIRVLSMDIDKYHPRSPYRGILLRRSENSFRCLTQEIQKESNFQLRIGVDNSDPINRFFKYGNCESLHSALPHSILSAEIYRFSLDQAYLMVAYENILELKYTFHSNLVELQTKKKWNIKKECNVYSAHFLYLDLHCNEEI
ncbi:hypothetical protein B4U79_18128 [Dinothrombium tinctorium]|uniref:Uncharacterized protein n=1 Tax=Dinothrombium tinctorium TaxID=1965070 RepID=A0A443R200_9ACAR|nr:hypothetical protein B4U79_18128 [Dinothrombium tinctorium]